MELKQGGERGHNVRGIKESVSKRLEHWSVLKVVKV